MRYRLLFVGRRARDPLVEATQTYVDRLSHYAKVDLVRIRECGIASEKDAILERLAPGETLVVLDERGRQLTTMALAQSIRKWQNAAATTVAFVVGGADGLHQEVIERAQLLLSLSPFTLPHRLAHVVLTEQLYRAHTILRGEPYHRG